MSLLQVYKSCLNNKIFYPFFGLVLVYFAIYQPFLDYPAENLGAAFCKCMPIWALAFVVKQSLVKCENDDDIHDKQCVMYGLLISSIGDAFLVARETLFTPGMLFFILAHVYYFFAFGPGDFSSRSTAAYLLVGVSALLTIFQGIDSFVLQLFVPVYICAIFVTAWRAQCRYEKDGTLSSAIASLGMAIFLLSDLLIGLDKWIVHVPMAELLVLSTYYLAQFSLAVGTTI